jgi:hypothetical protein
MYNEHQRRKQFSKFFLTMRYVGYREQTRVVSLVVLAVNAVSFRLLNKKIMFGR